MEQEDTTPQGEGAFHVANQPEILSEKPGMIINKSGMGDSAEAGVQAAVEASDKVGLVGVYELVCRDPDGRVKWIETFHNLVTNQGLNHALNTELVAGTQVTAWFVGLKGAGTPVAGDTHASHASWTEVTSYSESTRPAWTGVTSTAQSTTNAASKARFTMNANYSVSGAFLASNSTKGSTAGGSFLYNVADFATVRAGGSGDTLDATLTLTAVAL